MRDVGADDYVDVGLRNAIASGFAVGPRMLVAVHALGARGGHCDTTGFPYQRFGAETGIADGVASGPDQFRDAVRFQVKYGADVIKVCATGGVLSLGDDVDAPQVTQAEMDAIVDEAHRLGRRDRRARARRGRRESRDPRRHRFDRARIVPGRRSGEDDEGARHLPRADADGGRVRRRRKATRTYPPEIAAKALAGTRRTVGRVQRAVAAGVKIAFGTDSGVSPHGRNAEEFALLVEHGLSPAAALRTSAAAAALLGMDRIDRHLDAGKEADIVAVPGDVLRTSPPPSTCAS